jgi:hypothetical protein
VRCLREVVEEHGITVVDNAMLSQLNEFNNPWCNAEEASIRCSFGVPLARPETDTYVLKIRRGSQYTSVAFGDAAGEPAFSRRRLRQCDTPIWRFPGPPIR